MESTIASRKTRSFIRWLSVKASSFRCFRVTPRIACVSVRGPRAGFFPLIAFEAAAFGAAFFAGAGFFAAAGFFAEDLAALFAAGFFDAGFFDAGFFDAGFFDAGFAAALVAGFFLEELGMI
ncbi:MAG: hypothetical protein H0V56_07785 [Chthoniobacterales bacterium]|nr:hypothetical protein [Chthoniobacterales bacterium]